MFCKQLTKDHQDLLKKICDIYDKKNTDFIYCIDGIFSEKDIAQKRLLAQKTVIKPERDIFFDVGDFYIAGLKKDDEETWAKALEKLK